MPAIATLDFTEEDTQDSALADETAPQAAIDFKEFPQDQVAELVTHEDLPETLPEAIAPVQVEPLVFAEPALEIVPEKVSEAVAEIPVEEIHATKVLTNFKAAQISHREKRRQDFSKLLDKVSGLRFAINVKKFSVADQSALVREQEIALKDEKKNLKTVTDELIQAEKDLRDAEYAEANFDWTEGSPVTGEIYKPQTEAASGWVAPVPEARGGESPLLAELPPAATEGADLASSSAPTPTQHAPAGQRRKVDPATSADLWVLKKHSGSQGKVTDSMLEKLQGVDVRTVAHLESYMAMGNFVPGRVKGIGQAVVDKITDALMGWRRENPQPGEDEWETIPGEVSNTEVAFTPTTPLADELAPPAETEEATPEQLAYVAGCEAAVSDQPTTANPHEKGTGLYLAWDKGWQETSNG